MAPRFSSTLSGACVSPSPREPESRLSSGRGRVRPAPAYHQTVPVSLHRVDPRFVLPHPVRRAVVLDGLQGWRVGLEAAGIDVVEQGVVAADLVVGSARDAGAAAAAGAPSVIVEGARERRLQDAGFRAWRLLLRPTRERPTLALPLDQPSAVSYALERWSVVDRRWKAARMQAARALVSRGRFPSWASPVVTVATRQIGPPALVAAAGEFDLPGDVGWFLTFGQGDSLSRNAFQLFRPGAAQPEWILKFARVAGYSERFADDERGLALAGSAGGGVGHRVPSLIGRFELDGIQASLETAAAGRPLRDVLATPGDRVAKLQLIDRIGEWILEFGRRTQRPAEALEPELERLRREVVPSWRELGVPSGLADELPALPAVAQHNDLGAWNVVADGDSFVVVDWENAREAGMPLWTSSTSSGTRSSASTRPPPPSSCPAGSRASSPGRRRRHPSSSRGSGARPRRPACRPTRLGSSRRSAG